jgi:mRNA-degrading endonuclease YafQ of YafQ-DinJ toxin-antitoxin module
VEQTHYENTAIKIKDNTKNYMRFIFMNKKPVYGIALIILSGCCVTNPSKTPQPIDTVDATAVINNIKEELALFAETQPSQQYTTINQACGDTTGATNVNIIPVSASLQLKAIVTDVIGGALGAKIPVGTTGLTVDPSISGNATKLNTQQITLELGVDHQKTKPELRADIDKIEKEIAADEKYSKSQPKNFQKQVKEINAKKKSKIFTEYSELIDKESLQQKYIAQKPYDAAKYKDHQLAEALYRIRESLLAVDHTKQPCLKPNQLKSEIAFQVTKKVDGGLNLSFFVVSVGGELSHTDDRTQGLTVTFDLADSSSQLLIQ